MRRGGPHSVSGGGISADIDLDDGARLTSLRALGREWLASCGPRTPGDYLQPGSGGWDDAAPTVSACVLPDGTELADHGDAWQRPWQLETSGPGYLRASVRLPSAGITLARRVEGTVGGLRLTWTASTESVDPVPLFWSAHPLFVAEPGTRLSVGSTEPELTEEYPRRGRPRGMPDGVGVSALKAFVDGAASSASVIHANGDTLTLTWDADLLPYLGLYWDGGEFTPTPVVAIEPTTAHGDSAARAIAEGRTGSVRAGEPREWWLEVSVTRSRA